MKKQGVALQVAATYMGAIIGAGFASGQELVQFFLTFRGNGYWGLLISGILFACFGGLSIWLVHKLQVTSYTQLILEALGAKLGRLMEVWMTVFLFCGLCIMLAGSAAIFVEYLEAPYWLGLLVTGICLFAALLSGSNGVLLFNSCLIPFLIIISLAVSVLAMAKGAAPAQELLSPPVPNRGGVGSNWFLAALLYVSYNMITGVVVLASLGHEKRTGLVGGILGGSLLGILGMTMTRAMDYYYPQVLAYEIPMLFIAGHIHPILKYLYTLVLWFAMLTTAVADAFGLARRLSGLLQYKTAALVVILLALPFTRFGFARLVGSVYPFFGYIGLVMIVGLIFAAAEVILLNN
ncbi:MAG: hypothetical protein H0Z35_05980 [Thermoanaerobacteraceae bacterium]|nr:hypothetical protein [Thermoanaerobacteraceae bacterium]